MPPMLRIYDVILLLFPWHDDPIKACFVDMHEVMITGTVFLFQLLTPGELRLTVVVIITFLKAVLSYLLKSFVEFLSPRTLKWTRPMWALCGLDIIIFWPPELRATIYCRASIAITKRWRFTTSTPHLHNGVWKNSNFIGTLWTRYDRFLSSWIENNNKLQGFHCY